MAIVIVHEGSDWNADLYEQAMERVLPDPNNLPDGMVIHAASPGESGGWRVIDVWESEGQWESFRDGTLMPGMQEMNAPPFESKVTEAHNVMKA
jgi:hypothetical protein